LGRLQQDSWADYSRTPGQTNKAGLLGRLKQDERGKRAWHRAGQSTRGVTLDKYLSVVERPLLKTREDTVGEGRGNFLAGSLS